MVCYGLTPALPAEFPFVIDFSQSLYFHREGSGLLSGMSNPKEIIGEDQSIDPKWELEHIEAAVKSIPCWKILEFGQDRQDYMR
ncbi:MAG: hypothetical protein Ct9H300mP28_37660 [Pseudomonadota bacterium]|nr:MAG: hypothetical protein Ct9H300mP28_37660 [Pseudomonadota bacterium]